MSRTTQTGWKPMPGDLVEVWVTSPAWGGNPPVYSHKWAEPVRFVGEDQGLGDRGPRWLLHDGCTVIPQATSSLHAVDVSETLF